MKYNYPYTIDNGLGEKLIFREVVNESDGEKVIAENFVQPGAGPLMHIHLLQEEALTVISGEMTYQVLGQEPKIARAGETALFKRGVAHKFTNSGDTVLNCTGWLKPANTIVFYLSAIYDAQKKSGKPQPELFDAAYLMTRYKTEYDLPEMPFFVKKVILPIVCMTGKLLGKYDHFKDAPLPVKE